ncbi:MAG: FAD-dependent oxidoreductase, partial [Anaerolineales bacterium]
PARLAAFRAAAETAAAQGAGALRLNDYCPPQPEGFDGEPDGADLMTDPALIRQHFPYLAESTLGVIHARRAGWFSSTEFGGYLLEQARAAGLALIDDRVTGVATLGGRVSGVRLGSGREIGCGVFVNAVGPLAVDVGRLLGLELPLFCERHAKLGFHDHLGIIPRDAPMLIWSDPQALGWSDDEREILGEDEATRPLLNLMPSGAHLRPEGGGGSDIVLMLWAYDAHPVHPTWPPEFDPSFGDVVLRGLTMMVPGLAAYHQQSRRPSLDGGYYVKTRENRLLAGPLAVEGAYIIGGLSGYGLMAACGAAELLAGHITGTGLPDYAAAFSPARYDDPGYQARLAGWDDSGQL